MLFNLDLLALPFYNFFFFFLIIDLYFLIPVAIAQIFNPIAELVIPIGIPNKKQNQKFKYSNKNNTSRNNSRNKKVFHII